MRTGISPGKASCEAGKQCTDNSNTCRKPYQVSAGIFALWNYRSEFAVLVLPCGLVCDGLHHIPVLGDLAVLVKVVEYYARKYDFEPRTAFELSDASQLISLVNRGRGIALSLAPLLDNTVYENIVMVPFDDKDITWSVAFIHQDYEKLSAAAKKFIAYIIGNIK